jgi:type IV secretory pathway TrbL component
MQDSLKGLQGKVRLVCHDINGNLKFDTGFIKNTITNASFAVLSGLAGNTGSQTAFTYLAVGTSSTAPAASQTALAGEIVDSGLERAAATVSRVTTTQTNDTLQLVKAFAVTGTKTVEEAGIFNASSAGTMLGRALTTTKSVVSGDTLTVTYQVKFA